ncbi:MAG: CotH kinase family protein [Bacteroidia bacterium]|nr:CotH kinase family protein [Bacteroidia bacterium]
MISRLSFTILFLYFSPIAILSQTFTGNGGNVPDDGGFYYFDLPISGVTPSNCDTLFGLESVCINVTHTWISDFDIFLVSPSGTQIELTSGNGGDQDGYVNTCFNQESELVISQGAYPFTGTFRPEASLALVNNGQPTNGVWRLLIHDTYPGADEGTLLDWSITFGTNPAIPFHFESSNLPIIRINTFNQTIQDEPKILARMEIVDHPLPLRNFINDLPDDFHGTIGIEHRGASSQSFPKKSFGFEVWDVNQNDSDAAILDLPPQSDWVLHASFTDKTLMRNVMSYQLFNQMGHYASRSRYVELVLNGEYQGVYVLLEKIKKDENRVSISKLTVSDNFGDELTGGYIWKIDRYNGSDNSFAWRSKIHPCDENSPDTNFFLLEYPAADVVTPQQTAYIQSKMDSFELALMSPNFMDESIGYRRHIDFPSFISATIINELSKNVDAYRLSTYLHKDKDSKGGKIKLGPIWDYDLAWRNADYYGGADPAGWQYEVCGDGYQNPFWWKRLMEDTVWQNEFYCQWWHNRSTFLDTAYLANSMRERALFLHEAQQRNFEYWPILGSYVWPNPEPIAQTYSEEIENTIDWIKRRIEWMDAHIPGHCPILDHTGMDELSHPQNLLADWTCFPNPFQSSLTIQFNPGLFPLIKFELFNSTGAKVDEMLWMSNQGQSVEFHPKTNLASGTYLLKASFRNQTLGTKVLLKN